MTADAELVRRLRGLPGVEPLLAELDDAPRCFLVGGGVRDLLLGRPLSDLDVDVAVEGDVEPLARRLARRLDGELVLHDRFGTAAVALDGLEIDLARTRRERYAAPGALPEVEPAGLDEDLGRRDFTINAIAVGLSGEDLGAVHDPHGGRADLAAGRVRVLHADSFRDDPTRLLRALRYAARLGFELDDETERLARAAVADGALATVSGTRVGDELLDLLAEDEAPAAVALMAALGADRALHPSLRADAELVAAAKLGARETGAGPAPAALAALCVGAQREARPRGPGRGEGGEGAGSLTAWVDGLGVTAAERDAVLRATARAPELARDLSAALRPSELRALLDPEPPEALALALALGAPPGPLLDFVARLSRVRLEIDGGDLVAAGVPESPAIGRALERTLALKLDGELEGGRADELRAALAAAREAGGGG